MENKKHILIGGITGGIGNCIAKNLIAKGHAVSGFGRDSESLDLLSAETGVTTISCDGTDSAQVESTVQSLCSEWPKIDTYIHAIGSIFLKPAHLTSDADWLNTISINLNSAFYALRSVTKRMTKKGGGNCLFFSTAAAQIGIANHEAIAAAKGGIEAMVRSAAATYSQRGIRVNAIAPSLTDTPLAKPIIGSEQALQFSEKMHPLGQVGDATDIASLAEWLTSDQAKFITGQIFVVDGGISSIVPKPKI